MLAVSSSHYSRDCMPVIGSSDANCIYIISCEYIAKINVSITTFNFTEWIFSSIKVVYYFLRGIPPEPRTFPSVLIPVAIFIAGFYDITDSDNLHIRLIQKCPHVIRTHAAQSDGAHSNPVTGSYVTSLA